VDELDDTFPEHFYSIQQSSQLEFGTKPPGKRNIKKRRLKEPYFEKSTPALIKKLETFVLADYTAINWTIVERTQALMVVDRLLKNHAVVYLWDGINGDYILVPDSETANILLGDKDIRERISKIWDYDEITELAKSQLKITGKITLLDDYWINAACHPERRLPHRQLWKRLYDHSDVIPILKKATPPLKTFLKSSLITHCEERPNETKMINYHNILSVHVPANYSLPDHLPIFYQAIKNENDLRKIKCVGFVSNMDFNTLIFQYPHWQEISFNGVLWENISITPPSSSSTLSLIVLRIFRCAFSADAFELLLSNTGSLKELDIEQTQINGESSIFPKLNQLEKLKITLYFSPGYISQLIANSLNLRELNLSADRKYTTNNKININELISILKHKPNLRKLTLYDLTIEGDCENFPFLPSLRILNMEACKISKSVFEKILEKTPNLTKLKFNHAGFDYDLPAFNLPLLESLELSGIQTTPEQIACSVNAASQSIKVLKLENMSIENRPADFSVLYALKTVSIYKNGFANIFEESLLSKIFSPINLNVGISFSNPIYFPTVKSFTLERSHCNGNTLDNVLRSFPDLKNIEINHCNLLDSKIIFPEVIKLEIIEIKLSDFSVELFIAFLKNCGHVRVIKLIHNNITGDLKKLQEVLIEKEKLGCKVVEEKRFDNTFNFNQATSNSINITPIFSENSLLQDKPHSTSECLTLVSPNQKFQFNNIQNNLSQNMFIDKLCQYLVITKGDTPELLTEIRKGICDPLSHYFQSISSLPYWRTIINAIREWDGTHEKLTDFLKNCFTYILKFYYHSRNGIVNRPYIYLGDIAEIVINDLKSRKLLGDRIFHNFWHTIEIKSIPASLHFAVYNSNFTNGYKVVAPEQVYFIIKESLGELISLEINQNETLKPNISPIENIEKFIYEGGLLLFSKPNQYRLQINSLITVFRQKLLNGIGMLSYFALHQGLMVRATNYKPAWLLGLESQIPDVVNCTKLLLQLYAKLKPEKFIESLVESIGALTEQKQLSSLEACYCLGKQHPQLFSSQNLHHFNCLIHKQKTIASCKSKMQQHVKIPNHVDTAKEYFNQTLQANGIKQKLIKFQTIQQLALFQHAFQGYCFNISPSDIFYAHTPEDLICNIDVIKRSSPSNSSSSKCEYQKGEMCKKPAGLCHDFLISKKNSQAPTILFVNFSKFKKNDFSRFEDLLSSKRNADGTSLPENLLVIGMIAPEDPSCAADGYFYQKFNNNKSRVDNLPSHIASELQQTVVPLNIRAKTDQDVCGYPINLFHSRNWKDRLLGEWITLEDGYYFKEGLLSKAIKRRLPIIIQNGLWHDPDFVHFWKQLTLKKGSTINIEGEDLFIPENIELLKSEGYDWKELSENISFIHFPTPSSKILNPGLFPQFFLYDDFENNRMVPGWIESYKNKELCIHITRNLSEDQWAELLCEAKIYKVKLQFTLSPNVKLPKVLSEWFPTFNEPALPIPQFWHPTLIKTQPIIFIQSTDIDVTVTLIKKDYPHYLELDVTGLSASDLIYDYEELPETDTSLFPKLIKKEGILLTALKQNIPVIVKGTFSLELRDDLDQFLHERNLGKHYPTIPIVFVGDQKKLFNHHSPLYEHNVTKEEKEICLRDKGFTKEEISYEKLDKEPFVKLWARARYRRTTGLKDDDSAWKGIYTLPPVIKLSAFDANTSKQQSDAFIQRRYQQIEQWLKHNPYIVLTGLTGVGKTTTMLNKYKNNSLYDFYEGDKIFTDLPNVKSTKPKIIFIDEVNLLGKNLNQLEGLFHLPPAINGVPLNKDDKIVLACNDVKMGGERTLLKLLERHGNASLLEPFSLAFIYEEVIKPIFKESIFKEISLDITPYFLNVYQFLAEHSANQKEMLITTREIEMMALMTLSQALQSNSLEDIKNNAYRIALQIGKNCTPPDLLHKFLEKFPENTSLQQTSKARALQQINDFLSLSEFRQQSMHKKHRIGGLGGLFIDNSADYNVEEEIILTTLKQRGYQEIFLDTPDNEIPVKSYYRILPSMDLATRKEIEINAFRKGAKVIIPNITDFPMMEDLRNGLLMGKAADGEESDNPGFGIIAWKKPGHISTAIARRVITIPVDLLTSPEIKFQLVNLGANLALASILCEMYEKSREDQNNKILWEDFENIAKGIIVEENERVKQWDSKFGFTSVLQYGQLLQTYGINAAHSSSSSSSSTQSHVNNEMEVDVGNCTSSSFTG
jgi:hypothetical protein